MKKKLLIGAALCFSFAAGFARAESPATPDESASVKAAVLERVSYQTLAIGTRSGCDVPARMLVTSQAEWDRVWNKHVARDEIRMSAPPVDFSSKAVVVLLAGKTRGTLELQRITRTPQETTIYYVASKDGSGIAQPFHFAQIDAPSGSVRFADGNTDCSVCMKLPFKQ